MIFSFFTLLFISLSCRPQYDLEACNKLSMMKYKGIPNSYQNFEQNCKGVEIKYTAQLCQSAFSGIDANKEFIRSENAIW
jgi:hypothetical protein